MLEIPSFEDKGSDTASQKTTTKYQTNIDKGIVYMINELYM